MNTIEGDFCTAPLDATPYIASLAPASIPKFFANRIYFVCTRCDGKRGGCNAHSHRWHGTSFLCETVAILRQKGGDVPPVSLCRASVQQLAKAARQFPLYFGPCAAAEWANRCSLRSLPPVLHVTDAYALVVAGIASAPVVTHAYPPQLSTHAGRVRRWNEWLIAPHTLHRGWAPMIVAALRRATGLPPELAWHVVGFLMPP